jgi:hypothetical protein
MRAALMSFCPKVSATLTANSPMGFGFCHCSAAGCDAVRNGVSCQVETLRGDNCEQCFKLNRFPTFLDACCPDENE